MFPLLVPLKLSAALVLFPLSIARVVVGVSVLIEPAAVVGVGAAVDVGAGDVVEVVPAEAEEGFDVAAGALLDAVLEVVPTKDNDAAGLDAELEAQPATQLATIPTASNLLTALPFNRKLSLRIGDPDRRSG